MSPEEARAASFLVAMAARYLIVEKGPQVGAFPWPLEVLVPAVVVGELRSESPSSSLRKN